MDEQIKQLRKSLGMSQEKFAKEIGLTKNFISLVETGQRNLSTWMKTNGTQSRRWQKCL